MVEVILLLDFILFGKSVLELGFCLQYGFNVVGLCCDYEVFIDGMLEEKLCLGDILLVIGVWKVICQLQGCNCDFLVFSLLVEIDEVVLVLSKVLYVLFSLVVMVVLMVSGVVFNVVVVLVGCLLMGLFCCIDMDGVYCVIYW